MNIKLKRIKFKKYITNFELFNMKNIKKSRYHPPPKKKKN